MAGADLAALGSLGIGTCWGWLLAPVLRAVPVWGAVSTARVSGSAALAGGAAAAVLAGCCRAATAPCARTSTTCSRALDPPLLATVPEHRPTPPRLALLAQGNPLGLIYIPFVLPSLRLVSCRSA